MQLFGAVWVGPLSIGNYSRLARTWQHLDMDLDALTFAANVFGAALMLKMMVYRVHTLMLRRSETGRQ